MEPELVTEESKQTVSPANADAGRLFCAEGVAAKGAGGKYSQHAQTQHHAGSGSFQHGKSLI